MSKETFAGALSIAHVGKVIRIKTGDGTVVRGILTDVGGSSRTFVRPKKRTDEQGWPTTRKARALIKLEFGSLGTVVRANYADEVTIMDGVA